MSRLFCLEIRLASSAQLDIRFAHSSDRVIRPLRMQDLAGRGVGPVRSGDATGGTNFLPLFFDLSLRIANENSGTQHPI